MFLNCHSPRFINQHRNDHQFIVWQYRSTRTNLKPEVYFNSVGYRDTYATSFGMYLGHPQACQYKNFTKEDTVRIYWGNFLLGSPFLNSYTARWNNIDW